MKSPKGLFRMWGWCVIGIVLLALAVLVDIQNSFGWVMTTLMSLSKATLSAFLFYWVLRSILHTRTHEITSKLEKTKWEMALMVSTATVFGLALIP